MMQLGRYQPPSRQTVIYGQPVAQALPQVLSEHWVTQAVLVTNTSLTQPGGFSEQIQQVLADRFRNIVKGIRENTPREDVVRIAAALRSKGMEAVVALGGGSVVEAAKAARICVTNNVRDAADLDRLLTATTAAPPRPYLISIPTTLSAAEYTPDACVTDERTGVKHVFHHPDLAPDVVILDPAMTLLTPQRLWLSTGVRAINHAVETWCAMQPTPYSDATSLYAARTLFRTLPQSKTAPDDLEIRLACQIGSWMSIQGVTIGVSQGASHGIGQALSSIMGMAPGITSCVMLPHVLRFNAPVNGERQKALSEAAGRAGRPLSDVVEEIVAELGLPSRLRDAGVAEEMLPTIAEAALKNPRIKANPRPVEGERDMLAILEAAW
jgi:maleylacetate reductase